MAALLGGIAVGRSGPLNANYRLVFVDPAFDGVRVVATVVFEVRLGLDLILVGGFRLHLFNGIPSGSAFRRGRARQVTDGASIGALFFNDRLDFGSCRGHLIFKLRHSRWFYANALFGDLLASAMES
jgi:hypothetical protein